MISNSSDPVEFLIKNKHLPIRELKHHLKTKQQSIKQEILSLNPSVEIPPLEDISGLKAQLRVILDQLEEQKSSVGERLLHVKKSVDLLQRLLNFKYTSDLKRRVLEYSIVPRAGVLDGILSDLDAEFLGNPCSFNVSMYVIIDQQEHMQNIYQTAVSSQLSCMTWSTIEELFAQVNDRLSNMDSDLLVQIYLKALCKYLLDQPIFSFNSHFHSNYSHSTTFFQKYSHINVSNLEAFLRKWQLPVYQQLKHNEICGILESSFTSSEQSTNDLKFLPSATLLKCFSTCWDESVCIRSIGHLFWNTSLTLVEMYLRWALDSITSQSSIDSVLDTCQDTFNVEKMVH